MTATELRLFQPMSPSAFAPFDGVPGTCALARDADLTLLWCNNEYARLHETTAEGMVGSSLFTVLPRAMAQERADLMRPALHEGRMVAYQQVWLGSRWLTRVWPLDPDAFGCEGYFVVISRLNDPLEGCEAVQFVRTAHLGPLGVLSPRELEVFYYLAAGMTVSDIAKTLFRSEKTIGRHVENIHKKMGYTNRAELVRDAVERGVVAFTGDEWLHLVDPRPRN